MMSALQIVLVIAAVTTGRKIFLAIDKIAPVLEYDIPRCRSIDTRVLERVLHTRITIEVNEHFGLKRRALA